MEKYLSDSWISLFELLHKLDSSSTVLICNERKTKLFLEKEEENYYKLESEGYNKAIFMHKESDKTLYKGTISNLTNEDYAILDGKRLSFNPIKLMREKGLLIIKIYVKI